MTTRQQAIFNPAQFKAPQTEKDNDSNDPQNESGGSAAATTKKDYPMTGNATRDQVRKLIFESFAADHAQLPEQVKALSQLVEEIENDIFDECKDSKSKQYRDKSRAVQMKLKGPRFEQTRNDLRSGRVQSNIVIRDDYVQGKSSIQNTNPVSQMSQVNGGPRPPMMVGGPRPQLGMRPPGPAGPMMRPRFAGPPGGIAPPMFRPPPVQMVQLPPQPIEEQQVKPIEDPPQQFVQSSTIPFDDAPSHISRQISDQQRDSSPVQQKLHPQPPSSTDVHIDERPQLDQEDDHAQPLQNTYPLDTSSNLLQTSADNIGVAFEDDHSLMNPGKKKGKKKKKKGKKPGDGSQDTYLVGGETLEGGMNLDEDHAQQVSVIEEDKEELKADQEESGLRAQISEFAPISGAQSDEILNLRKQESDEFIYPTQQQEEAKNVTMLPGTIDERMIGIPSSSANQEMRANLIISNDDAEEISGEMVGFRKNEQGSEPEIQIQQVQKRQVIEEELKNDHKFGHQNHQQHRILNDLYEDENEQVERRGNHQKHFQDQTGNEDIIQARLESQEQLQRVSPDILRQPIAHLGTRTSSVKSLLSQQPNSSLIPSSQLEPSSALNIQNDSIKRLQDAITYKRAQKKELSEQLVHLENNCQLQTKKASMLLEENKTIRSELRQKDREIQNLKMQQDLSEQQLKLQIKTLERQLREKTSEIDQLKKEAQRRKEKEDRANSFSSQQYQQLKDRQVQSQSENEQQLNYLQNLLRSLDQRIQGGQGSVAASSGSNNNNNASSLIEGAGASNYQQQEQMMESVQKEMREMKQIYEGRMRELNEQLQDRMRNLQRVERQNVQLMEKNIKLSNMVQNMEVQQLSTLSTVAGSGSNQRDAFLGGNNAPHRGMRTTNTEEVDEARPRQVNNNNNPGQGRYYQMIGENDEGTGGLNQNNQIRNQQEFGYGEDGMAAPVVSGGGAMGAGGGVGTTAAHLYNNDAYDDDEGFNEGNNQMRGGSGGVGSVNPLQSRSLLNNLTDVTGSGGGQHLNEDVEDDDDQDLEEEGDEEDIEEERDDDYDHQIEGEGDYEGTNGGAAGAGGLDEEDQEEADEDVAGMDEEDDGFGEENQHNIEEDAEGAVAFGDSFPEEGIQNLQGRVKGAARGLRTHHNHNMQGLGHSHSNSQSAHYIDAIGQSSNSIDGGSYSSFVPPVSGGAGSTRINPVRAAGPAAGTRRITTNNNNEERKGQSSQGPRRGNKQQNQQHNITGNNATGSGGSSNMQNPRQRNTRGRQQRSNQQHLQQPFNQSHNANEGLQSNSGAMMMPGATPSSTIHPRGAGASNNEYFQSYGDSSTHYNTNNNNSRDQSITQLNPPREGAAGGGVVHTVSSSSRNPGILGTSAGMENSMMSAESGSTALLLDRGAGAFNSRVGQNNNFIPGSQNTGVASMGGQARGQTLPIQHLQANSNNNQQQQFQMMQYLGTAGGQSVTDLFSQDSSSAAPNNDSQISYTAAVGAPPQSRAAAPRQQRHQQHQQNNQQNAPISYYQGFEESKNESSGNGILLSAVVAQSSTYSNNNQTPTQQQPMRNTIAAAHSGSQNNNQAQMQHNQYSMPGGSSGEQEEDSYAGMFGAGAGSGMMAGNHVAAQYGGSNSSNHATASGFERGRNQQLQPPMSGSRLGFHHDQSHNTPTRNDSRKTSGANTPNKDGADTPTTKAYRHQQNPFVQVHNLTSSHLFFNSGSNQDESENPFSNNNITNQQQQNYSNQQQQQQQFGRGGPQSAASVLGGGPSGGGIQEADVINGSLFDS